MNNFLRVLKWIVLSLLTVLVVGVLYVRFARVTDKIIYRSENNYNKFDSYIDFEEYYIPLEKDIEIHAILFTPNVKPIGTIFHHLGKGMTLINAQKQYGSLIKKGFQVFAYERRGFAKSNGEDDNSITLKNDALQIFDVFLELESVKNTEVIVWGQSLGGAFATMNVAERHDKIKGLVLEGTFTSFPDMGKVYAHIINFENFKWAVPLLMNNDFPAEQEIKKINKPTVIIHSVSDTEVPFELGKSLYEASNRENTEFWEINGYHIAGINDCEEEYIEIFLRIIRQ